MVNKNIFLMQGKKEVGIARFRSSVKTEAPRGIKLPMPKKPRETYVVVFDPAGSLVCLDWMQVGHLSRTACIWAKRGMPLTCL